MTNISSRKTGILSLPPAGVLGAGIAPQALRAAGALPLLLGTDSQGRLFARDLAAMPHFLCAGRGEEVQALLQAMAASLIAAKTPSELKLAFADGGSCFGAFEGDPHLAFPAARMDGALAALEAVAAEMDRRASLIAGVKGRSISWFNGHVKELGAPDAPLEPLPYMAVFVSGLALLAKPAAGVLIRLLQLGAPYGIHCIIGAGGAAEAATDVVLGNVPCRACLRTATADDSVRLLGQAGAERIANPGEMLFLSRPVPLGGELLRVQGAFPGGMAVQALCAWWKAHASA